MLRLLLTGILLTYLAPQGLAAYAESTEKAIERLFAAAFNDTMQCPEAQSDSTPYQSLCKVIKNAKTANCREFIDDKAQAQCSALESIMSGKPLQFAPPKEIFLIKKIIETPIGTSCSSFPANIRPVCNGIRLGLGIDHDSLHKTYLYLENLVTEETVRSLELPSNARQHSSFAEGSQCSYCSKENCSGCLWYYPDYQQEFQRKVFAARSLLAEFRTEAQENLWEQYKILAQDPLNDSCYQSFVEAYWQQLTVNYWSAFSQQTQLMFQRYQRRHSDQRFPTNYHDALNRRSGSNILELKYLRNIKETIEKRDQDLIDKVLDLCFTESQDLEDSLHAAMVSRLSASH